MSAEVVNLRQFRKKSARAEKERQADANRVLYGRTKAEKQLTEALNQQQERKLDAGRIEHKDDQE